MPCCAMPSRAVPNRAEPRGGTGGAPGRVPPAAQVVRSAPVPSRAGPGRAPQAPCCSVRGGRAGRGARQAAGSPLLWVPPAPGAPRGGGGGTAPPGAGCWEPGVVSGLGDPRCPPRGWVLVRVMHAAFPTLASPGCY